MQGGYSENNLSAYTDLVAAVDANTNGLKAVTKGKNGYTFGKRQTGTGSGIQGQSQKTADAGIAAAVKEYSGNFGEMLRVDLDNTKDNTKYYGDLGSHMQTVVWKYSALMKAMPPRSRPTARSSQLTTGCTRPWVSSWV